VETKTIEADAAAQQASVKGGRGVENQQQGERFAQLLHELLGVRSPAGMHGAMNPLDFAPAPVGTELKAHVPDEVRHSEQKVVEEEVPQEEIEVAEKEVAQEEVEQEVVQEEMFVQEVVEEIVEEVIVVTPEDVEVLNAQTEWMVQEEVQKESGAGQGTPETPLNQEIRAEEAAVRTRVIGGGEQAVKDESAGKQMLEQKTFQRDRAKVDMGLPKELEAQAAELQNAALKDSADTKQFVRPNIDRFTQDVNENGRGGNSASNDGTDSLPEFTSPVIESVLKNLDLSKGGKAEQSLRYQLGSLLRPDLGAEAVARNTGGRSGTLLGSGSVTGIASSGETARQQANTKRPKLSSLPQAKQDEVIERVKEMLKNANAARSGNTMVVRLDPPKLGAMTVRVTHKSGQVFARIIPESQDVEAALRGRAGELTQALASIGVKPENIHVSFGQERSESESYQFKEFFNQQGGQSKQEDGFSGSTDQGTATLAHAGGSSDQNAADDAGWVA
jgi:flagellar hook-length control protein FliK